MKKLTEEEEQEIYNNFMAFINKAGSETNLFKQAQMMLSIKGKLAELYNRGYSDGHTEGLLQKSIKLN